MMCSSHVLMFNEGTLTNITELLGYEFYTNSGKFLLKQVSFLCVQMEFATVLLHMLHLPMMFISPSFSFHTHLAFYFSIFWIFICPGLF